MRDYSSAFRECLNNLDVEGIRKLWQHIQPNMPQPKTDEEALFALHHARTQTNSISARKRAYSHHWLRERKLPSGLPDNMKQSAERLYPIVVKAVGIAAGSNSPFLRPVIHLVREAMEDAVKEAVEDGKLDDAEYVTKRMQEAKVKAFDKLLGI